MAVEKSTFMHLLIVVIGKCKALEAAQEMKRAVEFSTEATTSIVERGLESVSDAALANSAPRKTKFVICGTKLCKSPELTVTC